MLDIDAFASRFEPWFQLVLNLDVLDDLQDALSVVSTVLVPRAGEELSHLLRLDVDGYEPLVRVVAAVVVGINEAPRTLDVLVVS